jgi:hypothetical protein
MATAGGPTGESGKGQDASARAAASEQTTDVRTDPTATPRTRVTRGLRAGAGESEDALRARYGVLVVFSGFAVTLGAFIAALIAFDTAQAISTTLAPITGLIGTIVGAYFGIQKGAEGKDAAEKGRQQAEQRAHAAEEDARNKTAKLAGSISDVRMVAWALDSAPPPHVQAEPPAPPAGTGSS